MKRAADWIKLLNLTPLPEEGGLYREIYRSKETIPASALPGRFNGDRCFATSIYYLLQQGELSAFHRLHQDEIWHFYEGGPLEVCILAQDGSCRIEWVGRQVEQGQHLQLVLRAGEIFGAIVEAGWEYSLIGCTVAPGFEFHDFERIPRDKLVEMYPCNHAEINRFSRA